MAGLPDLDFAPGHEIQSEVRDLFGATISFSASPSSREFFLVASFSRSALRLNCDSVTLILQSCLGGIAKDFLVTHLSGLMFRFSVDSKSVGFLMYNLKSFECAAFSVFFALWGENGPNWRKEYRSRASNQEKEWVQVLHKKRNLMLNLQGIRLLTHLIVLIVDKPHMHLFLLGFTFLMITHSSMRRFITIKFMVVQLDCNLRSALLKISNFVDPI